MTAVEWVPVEKWVPAPGRSVLIAVRNSSVAVWVGWWELAIGGWVDSEGYPARVTHWAPLPEAPAP